MAGIYRFGPFSLDVASYRLMRGDAPVALSPKLIDLLLYLVARPSALATKDDLLKALWPDVIVTDNALTQAVSELRQALGDDPARPQYVQTVARRGYRFIASVEAVPSADAEPPTGRSSSGPRRSRETSNLDAARAFADGRLRLESLVRAEVPAAIEDFKRAIELDPSFAAAYIGLANAHFWLYESSRYRRDADTRLQSLAIEGARCAVELDTGFAEAHATLAYLLASVGQTDEACAAARHAIRLDPDHWAHHFRLGNASWGEARLDALGKCLELYSDFPFAYLQRAMVHVARRAVEHAARALREGIGVQERHRAHRGRFPANGLHWMLGLVCLSRGEPAQAVAEFDREVGSVGDQLYGPEYAIAALTASGFARLQENAVSPAVDAFQRALEQYPEQPRARLGLALAWQRQHRSAEVRRELDAARKDVAALQRSERLVDAAMMRAGERVVSGHPDEAIQVLGQLLVEAPAGSAGWIIPIEPLFEPLRTRPAFRQVLQTLSTRAG